MCIKRGLVVVLVLVLIGSLLGCNAKTEGTGGSSSKKDETVIAEVNGEKILKWELDEKFQVEKENKNITDEMEAQPEREEEIKAIKLAILDQLINEKIIKQKMADAGFKEDKATLKAAKNRYDEIIADRAEALKEESGDNKKKDADYKKDAEKELLESLKKDGRSKDDHIDYLVQAVITEKFMDSLAEDIKVEDKEISEYYDENLRLQKENVDAIQYQSVVLYSPDEEKEYSLDEKKDEIKEAIINQKKVVVWQDLINEWTGEAEVVKHEDKL